MLEGMLKSDPACAGRNPINPIRIIRIAKRKGYPYGKQKLGAVDVMASSVPDITLTDLSEHDQVAVREYAEKIDVTTRRVYGRSTAQAETHRVRGHGLQAPA